MKTAYHEGYDAGVEHECNRILQILMEAAEIGEKRVPINEVEKHERHGGLELLALLTYRIEGKTTREAATQLQLDITKELKKKEVKKGD